MLILTLGVVLCCVAFLLWMLYRKHIQQQQVQNENRLLSDRLAAFSYDSSRKIQVFARLSQILASSFGRDVILKQIVNELSGFFPRYSVRVLLKTEDNHTMLSGASDTWNTIEHPPIAFTDVVNVSMHSGKQANSQWAEFLDSECLISYVYSFPLLTEEQVQGYLVIGMETQIELNDHLFFADIAGFLSSVLQNIFVVREKDYINEQFGRSVDPRVRDYLLSSKEEGRLLSLSVLFFDLRNFTALSEKVGPVKTVSLLNDIFSHCDEIIRSEGGFINKFTGDGFMAVFGAPIAMPDHEKKAVRAALNILSFMEIPAGIGIASGEAVAGTIGSAKRKEYTVIGDTVNTASRIEGLCKIFGSSLLVSDSALSNSGIDKESVRFLGRIKLKGKAEPVGVYDLQTLDETCRSEFNIALSLYYQQNFTEAHQRFSQLAVQFPMDAAVSWYERRSAIREKDPAQWDGAEQMTEK